MTEQGTPSLSLAWVPAPSLRAPLRGLWSWARLPWKPSIPFTQLPSPLGPPPCLAAGIGSTKGGASLAAHSGPAGPRPHVLGAIILLSLSPSRPNSFLDLPFSLHSFPPFMCPPIFLPLTTSPLSFFHFRENPKFKAAEAGLSPLPTPDTLPCVVTVSVGRIARKGIENCKGVQGIGENLL